MRYDLVFEGGGAKGMVFVGACQEFFSRGHTFDRLLGTSAGAITATLLAGGYTPEEMAEALLEKGADGKSVFAGFMGPPAAFGEEELRTSATQRLLDGVDFTFVPDFVQNKLHEALLQALAKSEMFRHVLGLVERGGWFGADRFVSWFSAKLDSGSWQGAKRDFSRMTLGQFFAATGIELSLVASDTTEESILVLNHRTAPDCPIVWAVRMSMSIPLLWDEVIWQTDWGLYQGRDIAGHAVVDGGLLSNFPIELFISDAPQVTKLMGPKKNTPVLGLLIDEKLPIAKGLFVRINIKPGELKTVQRLRRLVNTATGAHDKMVMDEYSHLVARLPAQGYGTTEFEMSDERRDALVKSGREAMTLYLDTPAGLVLPSKRPLGPHDPVTTAADRVATGILQAGVVTNIMEKADRTTSDPPTNEEAPVPLRGERLVMPGESVATKLPLLQIEPTGAAGVPEELKAAWTKNLIDGFQQNQQMFKNTLGAFMKPYWLTVWLYLALFAVGLGLFVVAAVIGLRNGNSVVAIAFAGLSVAAFLAFFLRQPLQAIEENLEFITWLGVAFNTYWTRLMYITDPKAVQAELKAAENDFRTSIERLTARHAELRGQRPGAMNPAAGGRDAK
jgi:NTE family protein